MEKRRGHGGLHTASSYTCFEGLARNEISLMRYASSNIYRMAQYTLPLTIYREHFIYLQHSPICNLSCREIEARRDFPLYVEHRNERVHDHDNNERVVIVSGRDSSVYKPNSPPP